MATVRLEVQCSGTGKWIGKGAFEVEGFITKHRDGMWSAEVDEVRALAVGETHHGGGGATPEWRVVRVE
jgi:hypothetical protein